MKSSRQVLLIGDTLQQLSVKLPVSLRLVCLLLLSLMGSQQCLLLPFLLLLIILVLIRACLHHHLTLFTSQLPLLFDGQEASRWGLPPSFVCFAVIIVPGEKIRFLPTKNIRILTCFHHRSLLHTTVSQSPLQLCATWCLLGELQPCVIHRSPGGKMWIGLKSQVEKLTCPSCIFAIYFWAQVSSTSFSSFFATAPLFFLGGSGLSKKYFLIYSALFFTRVTATVSQHNSRVPTPCSTINGSSSCIWLSYAGAYPRPCLINNLRATCPYTVLYPAGAHCCKAWLWSLCSRQCLSPSSQSALVGLTNCWLRRRKKTNPMNTL